MNVSNPPQALVYFTKSRNLLKADLVAELKTAGKDFGAQEIEMSELMKPSIFDTDRIKGLKANLEDIQVYIDEIENTADKEKFDKIKAEMQAKLQEETATAPEGFGKPQENADKFLDVTSMIKKKRPRADFEAQNGTSSKEEDKENQSKRLKLDNSQL